jgi:hypothetical protein
VSSRVSWLKILATVVRRNHAGRGAPAKPQAHPLSTRLVAGLSPMRGRCGAGTPAAPDAGAHPAFAFAPKPGHLAQTGGTNLATLWQLHTITTICASRPTPAPARFLTRLP